MHEHCVCPFTHACFRTTGGCRSLHGRIQTTPRGSVGAERIARLRLHSRAAIHVTSGEISALSRADATVCACPTTERNLGDGTVPADRLLSAGVGISLGSDSNVQINLLEDARELEYHLRILRLERAVLAAKHLFWCATEAGAASLNARGGSLEAGRPADFFTVALDDPSLAGAAPETLLSHVVFSAERTAVRDVAVGGKFVIRDGRHPLADEIIHEFTEVQRDLWA